MSMLQGTLTTKAVKNEDVGGLTLTSKLPTLNTTYYFCSTKNQTVFSEKKNAKKHTHNYRLSIYNINQITCKVFPLKLQSTYCFAASSINIYQLLSSHKFFFLIKLSKNNKKKHLNYVSKIKMPLVSF